MGDESPSTVREQVLVAPPELVRPVTEAFRRAALAALDSLPAGHGRLVIDLAATQDADSVGLAALIAIRRRARERHLAVRLRRVQPAFAELLRLAKLERQFEFEG